MLAGGVTEVQISGAKAAVERAMQGAKAAGAKRSIPLAVSIAAHSKLMAVIQDEWNEAVASAGVHDAELPVIGNVAARALMSSAELRQDIQSQMHSRVRWTETVQLLAGQGVTSFVEVGNGSVLQGLVKRIAATGKGLGTLRKLRTGATGVVTFTGLPADEYTVKPARAGYRFDPDSRLLTLAGTTRAATSPTARAAEEAKRRAARRHPRRSCER